jgi:tRNA A-37 threonylcarbamoyl transferase component Bud32
MPDQNRCPECDSQVSASGAAGGLCPRCLIKQGMAGQGPTMTGGGGGHFQPPAVEELAASFPKLEILELIGQGGMGAVYKARQPGLDRFVALKILSPELVRDAAFAERFGREARTLAKLSHPHIVGIHDFGEIDGMFFLIMEYVDGATLREVMRTGRLSTIDSLGLVPQLCGALQFAHDAGVVHRDIKPENILLDHSGRVKIADFGLAKLIAPGGAEGVSLTGSGAVMGTPAYMAPEQIEHPLDVDHRADIYAVGVVFYEMLTGELPLGRFDPPSNKVKLDIRLDGVVLRALAKEPMRRYQFASEVTADLKQIDDSEAQPAPPPAASQAGQRTIDIKRPPIVSWIAAYSLILAGLLPTLAAAASLYMLVGARGSFLASPPASLHIGGPPGRSLILLTCGASLSVMLAIWHLVAGLGALKLRNWGRFNLIILAIVELPLSLFALLSVFMPIGLPVMALSIVILIYLFKPAVARMFELGPGEATLQTAEADAIEALYKHNF